MTTPIPQVLSGLWSPLGDDQALLPDPHLGHKKCTPFPPPSFGSIGLACPPNAPRPFLIWFKIQATFISECPYGEDLICILPFLWVVFSFPGHPLFFSRWFGAAWRCVLESCRSPPLQLTGCTGVLTLTWAGVNSTIKTIPSWSFVFNGPPGYSGHPVFQSGNF